MEWSTKEAWLAGPTDLREAVVDDVPVPGQKVKVRGLSARFSAEVQGQLKLIQEGPMQVAKIDVAAMELLQFQHGVIEPQFTLDEARAVQDRMGPVFKKVIAKIDELSGVDKEAIEKAEDRFPAGGSGTDGPSGSNGTSAGDPGSDVHARTRPATGDAGS